MSNPTDGVASRPALPRGLALALAAAVSAGGLFLLAPDKAGAQGQAPQESGAAVWAKAACSNCHGNLGAGDGDPAYPQAPSLRDARLSRDQLQETVACGRPGTPMPFNLAGAYTETACYGLPLGKPPEVITRGAGLSAEQLNLLVDFLTKNVVGKTNITRENCALFFDGNANAPLCRQF